MPARVKEKLFYGWVVVAASFLICAVAYGVRFSFGVFFKSIEGEFALTRAETSAVFSIHMVFSAIFAIIGGWLIDRFGPKRVSLAMGILMTLSMLTTSVTTSAWQLFITYGLLLAMGIGAGYAMIMATASRWFHRKRGFAMGIVGSGVGVGTLIVSPLSANLIALFDWRVAFIVLGVISGVFFISASLFMKKDPAEIGLLPDGVKPVPVRDAPDRHRIDPPPGDTLLQASRTRTFWLLATVWLVWSFCVHLIVTHLVPHATDTGISPSEAAFIGGLFGAFCIPGRLFGGWVSDKVNKKVTSVTCALFQAGALLLLALTHETWGFYVFVIFFSLGYGGLDPPMLALAGDIFGLRSLGAIMGALVVPWGIGAAIGPAVGGLIYDASGSYSVAFLIGTALMVLAGISVLSIKKVTPATQRPLSS